MRTLFSLFIISLVFCSCQHSKPKEESKEEHKKVLSYAEKIEKISKRIEKDLSYAKEEIILLSQIRNTI